MTEKKEHPHAWFLRAIADGEPLESFEVHGVGWDSGRWDGAYSNIDHVMYSPASWQIRRKPRTIRIGEIDVPEPMKEAPAKGDLLFMVDLPSRTSIRFLWVDAPFQFDRIAARICHTTKEAAEIHRKALILVSGGTP